MVSISDYDRPNTVAGLFRQAQGACGVAREVPRQNQKLAVDIDLLDDAIRLFDPAADTYAIKVYVTKHRAEKGSVRFILNTFRESTAPLTSRQITELWVADRGLVADESTYVTIRMRIGAAIKSCVNQGLIEDTGWTEDHDANGPYKLWKLKRGGA